MDDKLNERLRERLLICSVCMDEFRDPRILPCFHSLCFECITNVIQSSSVTGRFFRCPQCRQDVCIPQGGIQELPINFYILSLQDELGNLEYEGKCELCTENCQPSQFKCLDCDKDICRYCIHSHRLNFHEEKPNILRIQRKHSSLSQVSSNTHCDVHDKESLQIFCFTCSCFICVICSCGPHKRHNLEPLAEKLKGVHATFNSVAAQLHTDIRNMEAANKILKDLRLEIQDASNRSLLALDRSFTEACSKLIEKRSDLEKEILTSEKDQLSNIEEFKKKAKILLKKMHVFNSYLLDMQSTDMCFEAFDCFNKFSLNLDVLRKDFSSNQLKIQKKHLLSSGNHNILVVPMGFLKNILYYGTLGKLRSSYQLLEVNEDTLYAETKPCGVSKMLNVYSIFKPVLIFFLAFFFFLFVSWIFDETSMLPILSSYMKENLYMKEIFEWVSDTWHWGIHAAREYYDHLFPRNESTEFEDTGT